MESTSHIGHGVRMDPINVYWLSYHDDILARGYWDNELLEDMFRRGNFIHHELKNIGTEMESNDFPEIPQGEGGIVIINGRTHTDDTVAINKDISKLAWCLFIITGDEEAVFPWRNIKHPIMKVWVMLPRMTEHNDASFKLPQGYATGTRELLKDIGYHEKTQDWFFAGQVNHERREQCIQELQYLTDSGQSPNGTYLVGNTFGKEILPRRDYLEHLAKTKIALCPSGIETPDSFRFYEALEAGCLPVVDAFSTNFKTPGFWKYVFGDDIPFPIVTYWDELITLMPTLLKEYPANANKCFAWWQQKKRDLYNRIIDDVKELSK